MVPVAPPVSALKVSEAMVPQYKVAHLSLANRWEENLAVIKARRFSRYPLCEKDLDTEELLYSAGRGRFETTAAVTSVVVLNSTRSDSPATMSLATCGFISGSSPP